MKFDAELDARGLLCPLPVLKARKQLGGLNSGEVLAVVADDPASEVDFPHFCKEQGHVLVAADTRALPYRFVIRKG